MNKLMSKNVRVLLSGVLVVALLLAACAPGTGGSAPAQPGGDAAPAGEPVTLRFANILPPTHIQSYAILKFAELVGERSANVTIETFLGGVLGTETEVTEAVSAGFVEMAAVGPAMDIFLPNVMTTEIPFIYRSLAHARAVLHDPRFIELTTIGAEEANVVPLGYDPGGFRVTAGNRRIESMADFPGFRIRLPNLPNYIQMGEALGASFVALPMGEVFPGLEQGVIDGLESSVGSIIGNRWYELCDYITVTNHIFAAHIWYVNADAYRALTPEDRTIIREAFREAMEWAWLQIEDEQESGLAYMESEGLTIIWPTDAFLADMRSSMTDVWDWFTGVAPNGREILDRIDEVYNEM